MVEWHNDGHCYLSGMIFDATRIVISYNIVYDRQRISVIEFQDFQNHRTLIVLDNIF